MRVLAAVCAVALLAISPVAAAASYGFSPAGRSLTQLTDLACYGNYCGLESSCAARTLEPSLRDPPIDNFDAACFLHDICYTCAEAGSGNATNAACCPDETLKGIDKAQCDRVLLNRLENDSVCNGSPLDDPSLTDVISRLFGGRDGYPAELLGCDGARKGAIGVIGALLAGRTFDDDLSGTGSPSATNRGNATCTTFSCPFSQSSQCFAPCGDDQCGGRCASQSGSGVNNGTSGGNGTSTSDNECPSGQVCNEYAHACFFPNGNPLNDAAHSTAQASVGGAIALLGVTGFIMNN